MKNSIGIGISTKDRWEDLRETLSRLESEGYFNLETIVIDDGSNHPKPESFSERFPWVQFIRYEKSSGYIVQRNRLARLLKSDYYLSLDDDSFPISGNLSEAAKYLRDNERIAALGFPIVKENVIGEKSMFTSPTLMRSYIGCGHLLKRKIFLQLGGYREELIHYNEEVEFCMKAYINGYYTYVYPDVIIQHNISSISRNAARNSYNYMRSSVIVGLLYFPFPFSLMKVVNCWRNAVDSRWNKYPEELFKGWCSGFITAWKVRKTRQGFTLRQYLTWKTGAHPELNL